MARSINFSDWLPFLLPAITPLLLFLLFIDKNMSKPRCSSLPPGPSRLPILGNLHQLILLPHRKLRLLSMKHVPLTYLQLGFVPVLVVSSARIAEEVLKSQDLYSCSRPQQKQFTMLSYNFSVVAFAPFGKNWREMHKMCVLRLLSMKRVQSFQCIREDEVEKMIASMSQSSSSYEPVNLSEKDDFHGLQHHL